MKKNWLVAGAVTLALIVGVPAAWAATGQAAQQAQAPAYSKQEYDDFQAAVNEQSAQQRAKLLEDFITKYPKSTLLPYLHQAAARTYMELKNYLSVIQHADKLLVFGESVDKLQGLEFVRIEMLKTRATAFFLAFNQRQISTKEQLEQGRDAAAQGIKFLDQWQKPEKLTDEQFAQEVKGDRILFNTVGGIAALQLKDYKTAVAFFRASLAVNANDPVTNYNLGRAYLQQSDEIRQQIADLAKQANSTTDPAAIENLKKQTEELAARQRAIVGDGFWAVARSLALKIQPGEAQIRTYLRNQLLRYQQPSCDALLDAQVNELVALAAGSVDRPANLSIPGRADLDKVLQESGTVDAILANLKAGGDTAKRTWLAACGAEFPELLGKVFEVSEGNESVVLKIFTAGTQETTEAGGEPNIELHVEGQPAAKRFKKDDLFVYSAALKSFTPEPFSLTLSKGKVREDTLPPEEKAPPKKSPAKKAPAKRPPAKRPPA